MDHMPGSLVFIALAVIAIGAQDIRRPPSIDLQPEGDHGQLHIVRGQANEVVDLQCRASGTPDPRYIWKKNGIEITTISKRDGTLILTQPGRNQEGVYQCYAENIYGTALSNRVELKLADMGDFGGGGPNTRRVSEGEPLRLPCDGKPDGYPDPTITWSIAKGMNDRTPLPVITNNRISIDEQGNLHMAYLTMSDEQLYLNPGGQVRGLYMCNVYNPALAVTKGGNFNRLMITKDANVADRAATVAYFTPSPVTALYGKQLSLQCICAGRPEPLVTWERVNGQLPGGRYSFDDRGRQLVIDPVQFDDEAQYQCTCDNGVGANQQTITVNVESTAAWEIQPSNTNATEGTAATFTCKGDGKPLPIIKWMKNGVAVESITDPRFSVNPDGSQITIENLSKATDLMVIQCELSNIHGYVFTSAYLNVLNPTVFVLTPSNVQLNPDQDVTFRCQASTDPSLELSIDWLRDDVPIMYKRDEIWKESDNSLVIYTSSMGDKGEKYAGSKYTCQASTTQGHVEVSAILEGTPGIGGVTGAGAGGLWWIAIIVAVVILIIIIILVCCICCARKVDYPVDTNERKAGNDPEKELADSGFHDFTRPEDQRGPGARSRGSIADSIKLDSDEDEDLDQYGDIDTGKFNEDGSFIGLYGPDEKKKKKKRKDENSPAYDGGIDNAAYPTGHGDTAV